MKKHSAVLAGLMIIALIFSVFSVSVSAAPTVTYSASSASGKTGDTVSINVSVSGGTDIWGCSLKLNYDSSKLQYVSNSTGAKYASGSIFNTGSSVNFSGQLASCKSGGGVIFTVKFKILASSGTVPLTLTAEGGANNIDINGNNIPLSVSNGSVTVTKPVTGISLDKTSVTLKKGETAQLNATVTPSDATNKSVTYTSSNTKVATVSGGKITAVGGGTATVTATAGGKSATCTVNVKVAQTGIAISGSKDRTVAEGSTLKLSTAKVPADATDSYSVSWTSSDNSIATVASNGTVTGVKPGTVQITATSNGWKAVYNVTVTEKSSTPVSETETESVTDEPSSTVDEPVSETATEITTEVNTTAAEEKELDYKKNDGKLLKKLKDNFFDKNKTVNKGYHYLMLVVVGVATAAVSIPVTALVTSNIVKNKSKGKEKDPTSYEDK